MFVLFESKDVRLTVESDMHPFCRFVTQDVAERLRTTVKSLLSLNPDVESQLVAGKARVCCLESGMELTCL